VLKALKRGYMRKNCYEDYICAMRELDIHKMLSHKHLIRLYEIIDDESDDKVYLVIEFAEKG
jgi:serine/threonine protein kinase